MAQGAPGLGQDREHQPRRLQAEALPRSRAVRMEAQAREGTAPTTPVGFTRSPAVTVASRSAASAARQRLRRCMKEKQANTMATAIAPATRSFWLLEAWRRAMGAVPTRTAPHEAIRRGAPSVLASPDAIGACKTKAPSWTKFAETFEAARTWRTSNRCSARGESAIWQVILAG